MCSQRAHVFCCLDKISPHRLVGALIDDRESFRSLGVQLLDFRTLSCCLIRPSNLCQTTSLCAGGGDPPFFFECFSEGSCPRND